MEHDLFLCHTGADKDWTRKLATDLEACRISNRPVKAFFDEWDIDYGVNIIERIDAALKQSRYVGLVLSPAMLRAPWPTAEWHSQVMDDPSGKGGRVLPLLLKKYDDDGAPIDLPFVLKPLKRFDFTQAARYRTELDSLVRKLGNLPPVRGGAKGSRGRLGSALQVPRELGQAAPDSFDEVLVSNLLPVTKLPERVFSEVTTATLKRDVWNSVPETVPPFFLRGGRLYSFVPPGAKDNVFKPFLTGADRKAEPIAALIADYDLSRQVIGMFNGGLRQHCRGLSLWAAKSDRGLFYPPIFGNAPPRKFTWGQGKSRTLAAMKESKKAGGARFGVHMAARMRFTLLGKEFHLLIDPAWMFTVDGIAPVGGKEMGVFSTKWGGREKNAALLRNVLMWGLLISEGSREALINVGCESEPAVLGVRSVPSHTSIGVGVFGDAIRLDRILAGEAAGEQEAGDELDQVAKEALTGESSSDDELSSHEEPSAPTDDEPDDDEELSLGI